MKLTQDQIKYVAKLANLPLTSEEEEKYGQQLAKILDYIDQLNKVDVKEVESTFNVTNLKNVMREDEVGQSLTQEETLSNTHQKNKDFFATKGVFEED